MKQLETTSEKLLELQKNALAEIAQADSIEKAESLRVKYLGKKGELTIILKGMGKLSAEERPVVGKVGNEVRTAIEEGINNAKTELKKAEQAKKLAEEVIDVTMPSKEFKVGKKHPITKIIDEVTDIFIGMGFSIAEGPEVETVRNNFDALNAPKDHPSRDMSDTFYINDDLLLRTQTSPVQIRTMEKEDLPIKIIADMSDTFYINDDLLLRTQTSPVQIRTMEKEDLPIKIIAPGRCFRSDSPDATHSPMFHQIELLVVGKDITMTEFKGTLNTFVQKLFGSETNTKDRASSCWKRHNNDRIQRNFKHICSEIIRK